MDSENQNGHGQVTEGPAYETIQIAFTRAPYGVQLVAHGVELLMAIAILRTALDELEAQLRMSRIQQAQQSAADAALAAKILQKPRA